MVSVIKLMSLQFWATYTYCLDTSYLCKNVLFNSIICTDQLSDDPREQVTSDHVFSMDIVCVPVGRITLPLRG